MIGELLKAYREKNGLSQHALAVAIGISPVTLWRLEHGHECYSTTMTKLIKWMFEESQVI